MKRHASLNRCFRHIWSAATQSWQVAPETARRARKGGRLSRSLLSVSHTVASVALSAISSLTFAQQAPPAVQLPTGGVVTQGAATISQSAVAQAASMIINQSTSKAVVNWSTFNVGQNASVTFIQPSRSSVTFNQIADQNPSQIFGQIKANGQIFLSNPNGIYFSPTSQVDVAGLVATTSSLDANAFMAGNTSLIDTGSSGRIVNQGKLSARYGGYIALLGSQVSNEGVIVARAGTVAMASGQVITLQFQGSHGLAGITTTPAKIASLIENKQAVYAPNGQIIFSAIAADALQSGVIKNSGTLSANSMVSRGGKIVLEGDEIVRCYSLFCKFM